MLSSLVVFLHFPFFLFNLIQFTLLVHRFIKEFPFDAETVFNKRLKIVLYQVLKAIIGQWCRQNGKYMSKNQCIQFGRTVTVEILICSELIFQECAAFSHFFNHLLVGVGCPIEYFQFFHNGTAFTPILYLIQWPWMHWTITSVCHFFKRLLVHPTDVQLWENRKIKSKSRVNEFFVLLHTYFSICKYFLR